MKTYTELEIEVLKSNSSIPASKIKYEVMKLQNFYKIKEYQPQYDYSKAEYIDNKTEITIICKEHGEFKIAPRNLLRGGGCSTCKSNAELEKLQKDFIEKASSKYPQYDYSKVQYKNYKNKVEIICKEHGSFIIGVSSFLKNGKCPECLLQEKKNRYTKPLDTFIEDAKKVHPQYDYSKVVYKNCKTKVEIICKEHGSFFTVPSSLLQGCGCPKCAKINLAKAQGLDKDEYFKRVYEKHGNKFKVFEDTYINKKSKIKIECPKHGILTIGATQLVKSDYGCPKCGKDMAPINTTTPFEDLVKQVEAKYKGKITLYENTYTILSEDIKANCKIHGDFISKPNLILKNNHGCPSCSLEHRGKKRIMPFSEFLEKANKQFNNKYTYLEETYTKSTAKMIAVCPHHGEFEITPNQHFKQVYGCIKCNPENEKGYRAYYFDKPTTLYYIKLIKGEEEYFKLGITTTTLGKRFSALTSEGLTYQTIATKTFETGSSAYYLEQYLLHQHGHNLIDFILLPKSGGNSEIFNQDIYESIKQYFD